MDLVHLHADDSPDHTPRTVISDILRPTSHVDGLSDYVNDPSAIELPAELRRFVGEQLPEFIVPAAVVIVESLPLTVNGKIDRRALPAPEFASEIKYRGARDRREEVLTSVYAEVLGLAPVGIDDRLFDLGGHSLSATRLVARIRDELGISRYRWSSKHPR